MNREAALPYVSYVLDDALSARQLDAMLPNARLVGWQCEFEPLFVAVQSYLPDCAVSAEEATEIAIDYLREIGWFSDPDSAHEPDYII